MEARKIASLGTYLACGGVGLFAAYRVLGGDSSGMGREFLVMNPIMNPEKDAALVEHTLSPVVQLIRGTYLALATGTGLAVGRGLAKLRERFVHERESKGMARERESRLGYHS